MLEDFPNELIIEIEKKLPIRDKVILKSINKNFTEILPSKSPQEKRKILCAQRTKIKKEYNNLSAHLKSAKIDQNGTFIKLYKEQIEEIQSKLAVTNKWIKKFQAQEKQAA